jgi:hypothetical protein
MRDVLDLLRTRRADQSFVAYGGAELAKAIGTDEKSVSGPKKLTSSKYFASGSGYRLSYKLTVQDATRTSPPEHCVAPDPGRESSDPGHGPDEPGGAGMSARPRRDRLRPWVQTNASYPDLQKRTSCPLPFGGNLAGWGARRERVISCRKLRRESAVRCPPQPQRVVLPQNSCRKPSPD